MNVLHENIDIWGIVSLVQNNAKRFSSVWFFEYEGEIENSKNLGTSNFWKYNMGIDVFTQIIMALYGHVKKFNVVVNVFKDTVFINLNLLKKRG